MANLIYSIVIFLNTLSIVALVFIVLQVRKRILFEFHELSSYIYFKFSEVIDRVKLLNDNLNNNSL